MLADAAADAAHAWLMQVRGVVCKDLQAATPLARESAVAAALNTVGRWRQSHEREAAALARRIDPRFDHLLAHAVRETRQSLSRTIGHPSLVVDGPTETGRFMRHVLMNVASRPVASTDGFACDRVDGEVCRFIVYRKAVRRALVLQCYETPDISFTPAPSHERSTCSSRSERRRQSSPSGTGSATASRAASGTASRAASGTGSAISLAPGDDIGPDDSVSCIDAS